MNSRLVWLAREIEGRHAGRQGMTRSRMVLYEAEQLPLPNLRQMTEEERKRISSAFDDLLAREEELDEREDEEELDWLEEKETERDVLDRAVLSTMDWRID